jgi:catechol 2,3-dioxygenase-like lactoylglutathione lyase family enzyme
MPDRPTSHELRAGEPWDVSYRDGSAPWDIGRPQPAFAQLAFAGDVLDAGCGTGEHALMAAAQGLRVLGVDVAETALAIARQKAVDRGLDAEFATCDARELEGLDRAFDTVLDCGLFHTFDSDERGDYVASLASVTRPGATVHVLCFSDTGPGELGPHPVSEAELRRAFSDGWSVTSIVPARIHTTFGPDGFAAWLARVERTPIDWPGPVTAVTLFVEDLAAARAFYTNVLEVPVRFADPESVVFGFGGLLVNVLVATAAPELVHPTPVAPPKSGVRMQLTVQVQDVDATVARLQRNGLTLLNGPTDRAWGVRTAAFADPAGHVWELAARIG